MRYKTYLSIGVIFLFCSVLALAALDLKFTTAISQAVDPASEGNVVTFTVSFRTVGGAVDNLKIIGGVDGVQLFERTYASILADKTRTDSFTWTATAGNHTVWFELDPGHTCGDSNYGNNRVEKAITVSGGGPVGQPNLKLGVTYSTASFIAGDSVTFNLKVGNDGTADSSACEMQFKKGGIVLQSYSIPSIASGGQINKTYIWTAECDAALNAMIDSNNANAESNEGDNEWSQQMTCSSAPAGLPDLTIGVTFSPLKFDTGEDVTFTIKIDNIGNAKAPSSQVIILVGMVGYKPAGIPALEAGGHHEFSIKIPFQCGAQFEIAVDYDNEIKESNENNNKWLRKMTCGKLFLTDSDKYRKLNVAIAPPAADAPDLTIISVKRLGKTPPQNGASMEVVVENIGLGKSKPCTLISTTEDNFVDVTMTIPALEKGAKYAARYVQQFLCGATMKIKVDANNKNRELNEENNTATKTFICLDLK
jgi:subtilase family serine protease